MIFLDGVGIGKEDYQYNPFFKFNFRIFNEIFGEIPSLNNQCLNKNGVYLFPSDPLLGVGGLPQSGTGQTSIFCGVNAAKIVGKHFGPYPYSTLIPVIKGKNIFIELIKKKKKVFFSNAYPKLFFNYLKSGKTRLSVTSLSSRSSGMRLNNASDVRKGNALTAEITNERWNLKLGYKLPVIKPETAAKRLLKIAGQNHFTLYEYFLTDHFGHGRYESEFEKDIPVLDNFLFTVITELDSKKNTLIICSDHGNIEDLSIKTHTLNPSLTLTAGEHAEYFKKKIKNITQIKRAILDVIK